MSYIDVDKFAVEICNFQAIDEDAANAMIWLLRTFPTADVVEVVRCKDCIHYISPDRGYPYCSMFSNVGEGEYFSVSDDHYCSCGERREQNEG